MITTISITLTIITTITIIITTLIELYFFSSSCSSLSSYRNWINSSLLSNSRQHYLSQQYPHPS